MTNPWKGCIVWEYQAESTVPHKKCTSGSVVEYRLAKARVAGSNPVLCSKKRTGQYRWYCPVLFVSASAHVPGFEVVFVSLRSVQYWHPQDVMDPAGSVGAKRSPPETSAPSCAGALPCSEVRMSSFHYGLGTLRFGRRRANLVVILKVEYRHAHLFCVLKSCTYL